MTQYAGLLMADAPTAMPLALLMDALVAALVLTFALLVRRA